MSLREVSYMNETKVFDESLLFHTSFEAPSVVETVPESRSYISVNAISGQIIGAAADNGYHRHYFRKLYDKFAYKSRMSDVVQTITVRCREGMVDKDVLVMCYGKINGGVTAIRTGSSIEAEGKFDRKNRFIDLAGHDSALESDQKRTIRYRGAVFVGDYCVWGGNVWNIAVDPKKGEILHSVSFQNQGWACRGARACSCGFDPDKIAG